ncbi:MAG: hypothetical protein N3E51_00280 [Candidatus Micrarchaeota archaeon]|nr:hypothetical protein [Candidatus Micrarchaeota archaeon]
MPQMPEAELIRGECLVRELQFSDEVKLTKKSLIRWLALSLGLISPRESRTGILDVFEALLYFHFKRRETKSDPDIHQLLAKIREIKKAEPNPKAVRYHLLQLKKMGLIESKKRKYRFVLSPAQENDELASALAFVYSQKIKSAFERISRAISQLEKMH